MDHDVIRMKMNGNLGMEVEESSGNVFAGLGLPDAEERFAKAMISRRRLSIAGSRPRI